MARDTDEMVSRSSRTRKEDETAHVLQQPKSPVVGILSGSMPE